MKTPTLSRREWLKTGGAAAAFAAFGGLPERLLAAAGQSRQIAGYNPALLPDTTTLAKWLQQLHDFGPIRMTGTPQCRAFEEFLAQRVTALGFTLERDQFRLTSWECRITDCSISIKEDSGATHDVEIVAYYPFGGSTRGRGPAVGRVLHVPAVGAEAVRAFADSIDAAALANSIVVVDMPLLRQAAPPANGAVRAAAAPAAARGPLGRFPEKAPDRVGGASPAGQGGRDIMEIFEHRSKGLIMCYTDISNDAARHNYLPFSDQHRLLPCIWAGADGSKYLQSVSGKATATIRCDARLTPDSRADTLLATLKGQSDEVVWLTTQTDGPNECNENGGLGVLALATYWSNVPLAERKRTIVACFPTAHYAAGAVADRVTGSGRRGGTGGALTKWPEVAKRIVGQISLEQMGAMEWVDLNGRFVATGNVASERWIVTPATEEASAKIFMASTIGENPAYSNAACVHEAGAPGEGGALRSRGLPGVGLMGQPTYFFRCDPDGVLEKLNPNVMRNQVAFATKMTVLMSRLTPDQLQGKAPITDADLFG
ncbi:MAG TPA: hypothetical protein VHZ73_13015 [Vicinamibacterales bacterium]|jgi:hypothetical protein|nr:hypothetical protein [Vicinamibacterales bacterium]